MTASAARTRLGGAAGRRLAHDPHRRAGNDALEGEPRHVDLLLRHARARDSGEAWAGRHAHRVDSGAQHATAARVDHAFVDERARRALRAETGTWRSHRRRPGRAGRSRRRRARARARPIGYLLAAGAAESRSGAKQSATLVRSRSAVRRYRRSRAPLAPLTTAPARWRRDSTLLIRRPCIVRRATLRPDARGRCAPPGRPRACSRSSASGRGRDAEPARAGRTARRAARRQACSTPSRRVGKNLLLRFEGGVVLRSHLRMNGRWLVRPRGASTPRAALARPPRRRASRRVQLERPGARAATTRASGRPRPGHPRRPARPRRDGREPARGRPAPRARRRAPRPAARRRDRQHVEGGGALGSAASRRGCTLAET